MTLPSTPNKDSWIEITIILIKVVGTTYKVVGKTYKVVGITYKVVGTTYKVVGTTYKVVGKTLPEFLCHHMNTRERCKPSG